MAKYFGTDGIRGEVGNSTITVEFVQKLGNAVGSIINECVDTNTVVVGQDTRSSSDFLKFSLVSGLNAAGINVLDLGVVPTPIVAFMTITKQKLFLAFRIPTKCGCCLNLANKSETINTLAVKELSPKFDSDI